MLVDDEARTNRYETQGVRKDGSLICLENFSSTIDWDDHLAIQTTTVDLTERKKAEAIVQQSHDELERRVQERSSELTQSETLYRSLVDRLPISVCRKDLQGRYTFVNRAFCQLLESTEDQLLGQCDADLLPSDLAERLELADKQVIETGSLKESIETLRRLDGRIHHLQAIQLPIQDENGHTVGTQTFFGDVTSLKQTEEDRNRYAAELERSNRDLEQFAYSVSHDLQSPLRTIANYCDLLQRRYSNDLNEEAVEFLTSTVEATHRMRCLLNDLLAFSRVTTDAQQFTSIDSAVPLRGAIENVREAIEAVGAQIDIGEMPAVLADSTQLLQVFQNLIDNAIHYRSEDPPQIQIEALELSDAWQFSVRDNGVGFDPNFKEHIFLMFRRLFADHELPGSGVGLAICKRILERHGGEIWAESQPGQGSCFFFTIAKAYIDPAKIQMPSSA
jgi:PAS domain S-box-containing protein